jgi:hypothetical protein
MNLQALIDGMSAQWQRERAETQMTLGKLIEILTTMGDTPVAGLGELDSYRGYYADLAFEPTGKAVPATQLLAECQAAMGRVFTGYKGGEFVMGAKTPLWVAHYGQCGLKLIAVNPDGSIVTAADDD